MSGKHGCLFCQAVHFDNWASNFNGSSFIYISGDCNIATTGVLDLSDVKVTNYSVSNVVIDGLNSSVVAHCPFLNLNSNAVVKNLNLKCVSGHSAFIVTGSGAKFNAVTIHDSPTLSVGVDSNTHINDLPVDIGLISFTDFTIHDNPIATLTRVTATLSCAYRVSAVRFPPYIVVAASPLSVFLNVANKSSNTSNCRVISTASYGNLVGYDYEVEYENKNAFVDPILNAKLRTTAFLAWILAVLIAVLAAKYDQSTALLRLVASSSSSSSSSSSTSST